MYPTRSPRIWGMLAMLMPIMLLAACGQTPTSTPNSATTGEDTTEISGAITVFAAASLTESYTELGNAFEAAYPGTSVTFNFAGSQQLAQQLGQGAPADVFASANTKQMGVAITAGRIISDTQQIFAHNRLVAIVSNDSPIPVTSLAALTTPDLKIILAAQEVPVGGYTQTFLDKANEEESLGADYKASVLTNVVSYEQTVKAVLTKIVLGEGDAGIVYSSDITEEAAQHLSTIAIPDQLNTIATYPIALVNDTANRETAQTFIAYVTSADGQAILAKHGFVSPEEISEEPIRQQTTPQPSLGNKELIVFSVAPFADAFPHVGQMFDSANKTQTIFNFAGGPQLEQQISQGADVDLFVYNEAHLMKAIETGRVVSGTEHLIAHSRPIVVLPADNPAGITTLKDLATLDLKIVLGTNETAIGQHTLTFLSKAEEEELFGIGYKNAVLANVVSYEPSVRAVFAKVLLGEADAAIVFTSDIAQDAERVITITLPETLISTTNFYMAPISDGANPEVARAFIDYLLSSDGQAVLTEYGFQPIE